MRSSKHDIKSMRHTSFESEIDITSCTWRSPTHYWNQKKEKKKKTSSIQQSIFETKMKLVKDKSHMLFNTYFFGIIFQVQSKIHDKD